MVEQMGGGECEAACPKEISLNNIARMNRDQIVAKVVSGS
jgi:Na+-translocating ferredoxin:NAD+ oxidoreductase RnfC subunit